MSADENKAIVRQWLDDVWVNGHVDRIPQYYAPTYTLDGEAKSLERIADEIKTLHTANPDGHLTIHAMIAEGDTVAYRYAWQWTNQTPVPDDIFGTIPATGNPITVRFMTFVRLMDGKIVEDWASMDMLGMYQQLGVIPMPQQAHQAAG